MKIKTITFELKQTTYSTLVMSSENGYIMPVTGKELVEMVNEISGQPMQAFMDSKTDSETVELKGYEIEEH